MKKFVVALPLCLAAVVAGAALAASPAAEKQFVDTYRKAFDAKDDKTLASLLYTKGADPQALEFYKMMMSNDGSGKITSIELVDLTAEDKVRAEKSSSPDGRVMKLVLTPVKKLVIKSETKDKNGSSSSTSEVFVAEQDGRLYIPVPAVVK